ncbi:hypothetical protein D3C76_944020 [compost metagenome]
MRLISSVTADCSSVAVATWWFMSLMRSTCPVIAVKDAPVRWLDSTPVPVAACPECIDDTAFSAPCLRLPIICWISSVEAWVRRAKVRTSSATTANPRPISPALAASMAALSASRLVCSEIPRITANT